MTTTSTIPSVSTVLPVSSVQSAAAVQCGSFYNATGSAALSLLENKSLAGRPRIVTVESHTQGEPTRIVVGGLPELHEANAIATRNRLEEECDSIRRLLMLEPRGHRDMFGAFLFPPTRPDADLGVVYSHSEGFSNMCGHGSIGVGTFAVESGLVTGKYDSFAEIRNDDIDVRLDTPAGLVTVCVHVREGKVTGATLTNVPSFVALRDVTLELDVPGVPEVRTTIAFGGNFFALVDADALGLDITLANSRKVADLGMEILAAAREQCEVKHPLVDISGVDLVEFGSVSPNKQHYYRNGVVFGELQVDRSPCGTGTSAKLATLVDSGAIDFGERGVFSSITGSTFLGEPVRRTAVAQYDAVIPRITGKAYTTGVSTYVLDEDDIYPEGFLV